MSDDVTASFNLSVESNAAQVARDGADGLANLQEKIAGSVEQLRNMNAAFRALKGGAGVSTAAIDDVKARLASQKSVLAGQQLAYLKAGGTFREQGERQKRQQEAERATLAAKAAAEKRAAGTTKANSAAMFAGASAAGAIAVVLAEKAIDAAKAVARMAAEFGKFALVTADARRSELLQLEGLTKVRMGLYYLGGGYQIAADKASFLQEQIDSVSADSALGRDKIAGYAQQLYMTGLRAGNLQAALEGMAITGATQGEAQAQRFAGMAAGARMAGMSVKALAGDVKARLGGIAAAQMLSLSVQSQKLHETFAMLFSGLRIEPFLRGLKTVTDLFKQNTIEGVALRQLLEDMFQPLIDGAPTVGTLVRKTLQGIIIGVLELQGVFLSAKIAYYEAFGNSKTLGKIDMLSAAVRLGENAMIGLASAAVAAGAAVAAVGAALAVPVAMGWALGFGIAFAADKIDTFAKKFGSSAIGIGFNFVKGIADGITGGLPTLIGAVMTAGGAMVNAFRKRLEIHSPSAVMFRETKHVTAGTVNALKAGRSKVEAAAAEGIAAPITKGASGKAGAAATSRASQEIHFHFAPGAIPVSGDGKESDIREAVRRAMSELLAGKLIIAGGAPA